MTGTGMESWLQLGALGCALLYVLVRVEKALGALACAQRQTNQILLLLLKKVGLSDGAAMDMTDTDKSNGRGVYQAIGDAEAHNA